MKTLAPTLLVVALLAGCGEPEPPKPAASPAPAGGAVALPATVDYPLTTCLVSDEKLGGMGDPVIYMHEGTEVRFCCAKCIDIFKKDPAKYLAKLEEAKKAK